MRKIWVTGSVSIVACFWNQMVCHIVKESSILKSSSLYVSQSEDGEYIVYSGQDQSLSSSLSVDYMSLVDSTHIPLNYLQGIWNKTTELLGTGNAIVTAPGCETGAKYILSYSGSKPHLVTPKKAKFLPVILLVQTGRGWVFVLILWQWLRWMEDYRISQQELKG